MAWFSAAFVGTRALQVLSECGLVLFDSRRTFESFGTVGVVGTFLLAVASLCSAQLQCCCTVVGLVFRDLIEGRGSHAGTVSSHHRSGYCSGLW